MGNPPYITVKDKALNEAYRKTYTTCSGKYALSVPFMELFFALAQRGDTTTVAGFVGQITSNSFMKRAYGKKLVVELLAGKDSLNPVELTTVIDTSGAYIPGHGTPTLLLFGRRRAPAHDAIRTIRGVRGEPGVPRVPSDGLVWAEIVRAARGTDEFTGDYISIESTPRSRMAAHPWSLTGGASTALLDQLRAQDSTLSEWVQEAGFAAITGEDAAFVRPRARLWPAFGDVKAIAPLVDGKGVRDWSVESSDWVFAPHLLSEEARIAFGNRVLWPWRINLRAGLYFDQTRSQRGLADYDYVFSKTARLLDDSMLVWANVSTHNHVAQLGEGRVPKETAPVMVLSPRAKSNASGLLGIMNSSAACFWLKQVSHNKGDSTDSRGARVTGDPAFDTFQFNAGQWLGLPVPRSLPSDRVAHLTEMQRRSRNALDRVPVGDSTSTWTPVGLARDEWEHARAQMVYVQEELDWEVYRSYGLLEDDLTYSDGDVVGIALGERAFEIALARRIADGLEESAWFERHGSTPVTEIPAHWPADYRELVQRRLDLIESDPFINLLERPEYKRRWAAKSWEEMERDALTGFVLDKLETAAWWSDGQGPRVLSVAQLADYARKDEDLVEALRLLTGAQDVDVTKALGPLVKDEAVPFLAAYRYKPTGLVKRAEWERVWDLQRAEDRGWDGGPAKPIPVPPKYKPADFVRTSYWQARGKLDVPKERFVSYPAAGREGDPTEVLGWAGWDHAQQALALARLVTERAAEGWGTDQLVPLLAGLAELEPWLVQWHHEVVPEFGTSPAEAIRGLLDQQLATHSLTRTDLAEWQPSGAHGTVN